MTITIYHNPACATSRNTLALIRNSGEEPIIINYLTDPPSRARLLDMIAAAGLTVRQALREKEALADELGLHLVHVNDATLLDAMLAHPRLINRPFVVAPNGTRLCRPSELVLDILARPQGAAFSKEDGTAVIDHEGNRIIRVNRIDDRV